LQNEISPNSGITYIRVLNGFVSHKAKNDKFVRDAEYARGLQPIPSVPSKRSDISVTSQLPHTGAVVQTYKSAVNDAPLTQKKVINYHPYS
jgi:hypothetical protein